MKRERREHFNGDRLVKKMAEKRLTQKRLAEMLNVDSSSLNKRIKAGDMARSELVSICGLIDSDVDYILGAADNDYGYKKHDEPGGGYTTPEEFAAAYYRQDNKENACCIKSAFDISGNRTVSIKISEYRELSGLIEDLVNRGYLIEIKQGIARALTDNPV